MVVIELCAGFAALTLHLNGQRPPVSRIGSKWGYAEAIAVHMGIRGAPSAAILVESDPATHNAMTHLLQQPAALSEAISAVSAGKPRDVWEHCGRLKDAAGMEGAAAFWVWTAGARGGIMPVFKGGHIRRPSVVGFIPSLSSLVERVAAFPAMGNVVTKCTDARRVKPLSGAMVYIDPPYESTLQYNQSLSRDEVVNLAVKWRDAGNLVCVSERAPLAIPGFRHVDITNLRRGQRRRSLTASTHEFLTIGDGRR